MNRYVVEVRITPREGLLDPEGKAVHNALRSLDFGEVQDVRVGRLVRVELTAPTVEEAFARADAMCRQLLANPVTEDYEIDIDTIS
ncbi:MAG: phosphoribosylformylglycinamidine synthase subunit PurS [bacterium]